MVTPLDVIPSFHRALRNDMRIIDDTAYEAAAGDGNLAPTVERLRFFSEILKWHADGEDELVFPAMDKVAPLVAENLRPRFRPLAKLRQLSRRLRTSKKKS